MAVSASASASSSRKKYEVFISFRGSDVRFGLLSHLENKLRQMGIDVYVDERLERGEEISSALVKAIEGSMIALVIFSKDYASSKWCLEELVKIMECKEAKQQIVIPIFYHIDPSDVRHQRGTYEEALKKFNDNTKKLQIWRSVLQKTAGLSGYHSSNFQDEFSLVNAIVDGVLQILKEKSQIDPRSKLIGFHQNFVSVESLMEVESLEEEVRVLGIWGPGGIGKTTLAKAIFYEFKSKFESHCCLENVRESTMIPGLSLRQKLLSKLLDQKDYIDMDDAMRRLEKIKVLIVLDDVDNLKQLENLVGQELYLGRGSRVIITSRNKHVLRNALRSGGIHEKYIHEVKELNFKESLELFSRHAFRKILPNMKYEELAKRTVDIAKGVPLALKILGSHFHSRDETYWEAELNKLQKFPHQDIQNILKVSYDGLDLIEKEIFLDIAFFFLGEKKAEVTLVLEACHLGAISGIQNLIDKALIKLDRCDKIVMHDLIQEMAKQIVREECMKHLERRSRLNDAEEIYALLQSNMGTEEIEGIMLNVSQIKSLQLSADAFMKMKNLRILKIWGYSIWQPNTHIELPHGLNYLPNELRYFYWNSCPLTSLPLGSYLENLVELNMQCSNVEKLWDGKQRLGHLKKIDLFYSDQLRELPDLSMARKLEYVNLGLCENLSTIHPSILSHNNIVVVKVNGCPKLEYIESKTHLESLTIFSARGCRNLKKFSLSSKKLRELYLDDGTIVKIFHLPNSHCTELRELSVGGEGLRRLPIDELCCLTNLEVLAVHNFKQEIHTGEMCSLFDAWSNLRELWLVGWSRLSEIPGNIKCLTRLQSLSLEYCGVETLPACVSQLSSLTYIYLNGCKRLKSILGLPPMLQKLDASDCTLLKTVSSNALVSNRCSFSFEDCVKLDEPSLAFIEELTRSSLTSVPSDPNEDGDYHAETCYPGSRVPEWMEYKTEDSNAIKFPCCPERSHDILLCCVAPPGHAASRRRLWGLYCKCYGDDNNEYGAGRTGRSSDYFQTHELNKDHVFLWYIQGGLSAAKISCEFFLSVVGKEGSGVPAKACGVHVIYH